MSIRPKANRSGLAEQENTPAAAVPPQLRTRNIGIVSRDYMRRYGNGRRDFSYVIPEVLTLLDNEGCDTILFSLFSLFACDRVGLLSSIPLRHIKSVLYEEFEDGKRKRKGGRFVVLYREGNKWHEYSFRQSFGSLNGIDNRTMATFVKEVAVSRILGNCCILLCGESNGVKYSKTKKRVQDDFGLKKAIPKDAKVILNPIHDRMTRFEMKLKRRFLSQNGRWVVSVWNKGKQDKNGKTRDGRKPAWSIFHDGKIEEVVVMPIPNEMGVEIGILRVES
jgi:hypothetical protein